MTEMRARMESAQHILYRVLTKEYGAKQTGMQIHDNKIRLDVKCEKDLTSIPKEDFELKVNKVIAMNLPVTKTTYQRDQVPSDIDVNYPPLKWWACGSSSNTRWQTAIGWLTSALH